LPALPRLRPKQKPNGPLRAPQQPIAEAPIAAGTRQRQGPHGKDDRCRGIAIEPPGAPTRHLPDRAMQDVRIGQLCGERGAGDIGRQGRQGAGERIRHHVVLAEISFEDGQRFRTRLAQADEQAMPRPDGFGEQGIL
jgi:hypothetical protein